MTLFCIYTCLYPSWLQLRLEAQESKYQPSVHFVPNLERAINPTRNHTCLRIPAQGPDPLPAVVSERPFTDFKENWIGSRGSRCHCFGLFSWDEVWTSIYPFNSLPDPNSVAKMEGSPTTCFYIPSPELRDLSVPLVTIMSLT